MFIIRWTGWRMPGQPEYLGTRKGKLTLVSRDVARRFDTHDAAVRFCKEFIRKGRFGGQWRPLCSIEPVGVA